MYSSFWEEKKTYDVVGIIFLELLNIGVDQRFGIPAFNAEFLFTRKTGCGQQNELHHGDDSVVFHNLWRRF